MDEYHVVGVTTIPYPRYGSIITIVTKEETTYFMSIGDIPHMHLPRLCKDVINDSGNKGQWVFCKHLYYIFKYMCNVDYATDKFIHAPTFIYNEVMCLLELACVAKQAYCYDSDWHIHLVFTYRNTCTTHCCYNSMVVCHNKVLYISM